MIKDEELAMMMSLKVFSDFDLNIEAVLTGV
jgi:hypothetical protein